ANNPGLYAALERDYGVPAGVLIAIHGMETGFGNFMGDTPVVSAITTLAYDCRRPGFFTPHAISALMLVDRGEIPNATIGARHGQLPASEGLAAGARLSAGRAEFRGDQGMERGRSLSAGNCHHGPAHRRLSHAERRLRVCSRPASPLGIIHRSTQNRRAAGA